MSLITSCPACGTMFRVVPDQLKISEGWVRCGHCSEVFDASKHLSDESVLVEPELAQQATRPTELPTSPAEMLTRPAEIEEEKEPEEPQRPTPAQRGATESSDPSDFYGEDSHVLLEPSPLDAPFVFRPKEVLALRDSQIPEPGEESQMLPEDFGSRPRRYRDDEDLDDVSFVQQARREAYWNRPGMRMRLAVTGVLLAALLVLQLVYEDRDRLAVSSPGMRPLLEGMCSVFGCSLGAPQQIESVVIETSGFNRLREDTYRLSFTLRNAASVPVAAPAIELTITDALDQTIARRVLTPAELGADPAVIPATSDWSRTVGIALDSSGGARVAGYRLLAFYP
jgi:predicted Zn finger-like uncharacterized protein